MSDGPPRLGGVPVLTPDATHMRLAMLLWGDAGCGKTTLAATMPGHKLFVQFDPDGALSLAGRDDVSVLDLSAENPVTVMTQFRTPDPYGLGDYLRKHAEVETVVWDSMTTLAYMALREAVTRNQRSSLEQPGMHGYTWRNSMMLRIATAAMQVTGALDRNVCFTTHENAPDRDDEGRVLSITLALSEGTANQLGLRLNEVSHVRDDGNKRIIAVRPCRMRKPMKTRLFNATQPEFEWRYDPNTRKGDTISGWFTTWKDGKGNKLPLPK